MAEVPGLAPAALERLCKALDDDSGSEIGRLLAQARIADVAPADTKWRRLLAAFEARQARDRCANGVIGYVEGAMAPPRFVGRREDYEARRRELNEILAFAGVELGADGRCRASIPVATLAEAERRAQGLRAELTRRGVHPDVLRFCRAELLDEDYFHAILEATKSVADKLRTRTGHSGDGASLVEAAFGLTGGVPPLAINTLRTEPEKDEQRGFANVLKGVFGMYRNPTAHAPRLTWATTERDALDALTLLSLLHRRIDAAISTRPEP